MVDSINVRSSEAWLKDPGAFQEQKKSHEKLAKDINPKAPTGSAASLGVLQSSAGSLGAGDAYDANKFQRQAELANQMKRFAND